MALSPGQKLRLLLHVEGVQAERDLRANPWGMNPRLSTDAFYDLILAATGSEKEARSRAKARRHALIREGNE